MAQDGKWTDVAKSFHNFNDIHKPCRWLFQWWQLGRGVHYMWTPGSKELFLGDGWWCYISAKIPNVIPLWSISKRATLKFLPFGESMIWCQNDAFKLWSPQVIKMSHRWQCVGSKFNGIYHLFRRFTKWFATLQVGEITNEIMDFTFEFHVV